MSGEILRYLLAGGANTAATWALYLLLLVWLDYRVAYVLAFVAGIAISWGLLRHWVFARAGRRYSVLWVALVQGLQLLLGLLVVQAWVAWLGGAKWLAPLAAIAVCVPIVFALQRLVFPPRAAS